MNRMQALAYDFCKAMCERIGIDSSHDHTHMARVAALTQELNARYGKHVSDDENTVMILSSFTHDLCDHKYIQVDIGLKYIYDWLSTLPIRIEQRDAIIKIINTMSYSKVKCDGYPTDLGKYELAYHHTRIADLIDAYDVMRCYNFQTTKYPLQSEHEKWREVVKLFHIRILQQKDKYIYPVCPYAYDLVEPLHERAKEQIMEAERIYCSNIE